MQEVKALALRISSMPSAQAHQVSSQLTHEMHARLQAIGTVAEQQSGCSAFTCDELQARVRGTHAELLPQAVLRAVQAYEERRAAALKPSTRSGRTYDAQASGGVPS